MEEYRLTQLDRGLVLQYLGYKGSVLPDRILDLVSLCENQTIALAQPKYRYSRHALVHGRETSGTEQTAAGLPPGVSAAEGCIRAAGTQVILTGHSIQEHLQGCGEIYLMCATLGLAVDRNIRRKMISAPDEGVVLDSCASVAIEQVMDRMEHEIEQLVDKEGLFLTWRFSPGYGDLPMDCQGDMLSALDAHRKMGLSVSTDMLLTPMKSVTAIAGIMDSRKDARPNKCDFCNHKERCTFRSAGNRCG